MDNFGFIEYRPLSCKLATYAKQKHFTFPGGASAPPCPCLRAPIAILLGRITGLAGPFVSLSVHPAFVLILKMKRRTETKVDVNVVQSRSDRCANFRLQRCGCI